MRSLAACIAAAVLLVGATALAQEGESPQRFAVELKFGPYYPDVDTEPGEPGVGTPYEDVFGEKQTFMFLAEFDWQFLRLPGISFGIGLLAGYFQDSGKGLDPDTGERAALPRFTKVPLVPFVKAGVSYYIWWVENGRGIGRYEGTTGYGGTWGWNFSAGLMLLLDFFEPSASRTFDQEVGVNNSYLYADFFLARIDNFGDRNKLNLSDMTWTVGLAIEF
ncbi:MAG: hypothetical protein JRG91_11030 [Deltaproteobacteria bacterium]|nr:hypothetical protein [Deltaproteobacteria bacterium]